MIDKLPSEAFVALREYFEAHSRATLLLLTAARDYAAARCLLLNGFVTGLVLGAQAIEKVLKAYLLFHDPQRKVKSLSHSLPRLLDEAHALYPHLALSRFAESVEKFRRHYQTRYPDNTDASTSMTTADVFELDEIIIFLNENLPCPRNVRLRTGFYASITFSLGYAQTVTPWERWIKENNRVLALLWPRIVAEHDQVMRELHPD